MKITTAYIAASVNRHSGAADVSSDSLVIFGSSNLIAIWDIANTDGAISETLPGHEGTVTCIRIHTSQSFFSADDRGVVRCWRKAGSQWVSTKFQAHAKAVSCLCVFGDCLATGSSEAVVKIWKLPPDLEKDEIKKNQTISLSGRYPLALGLARLPRSNSLLLAIGGTDKNVQLWTRSEDSFVRSAVLMGHEDWVRSLSFHSPDAEGPLVLASASQDATIRLWNIEIFKKEPTVQKADALSDDFLDAFEESLEDFAETEEGGRAISLKRHIMSVISDQRSTLFSVTFDALLIGHEAGVTSVLWRPSATDSAPTLLSTSTDSSMILWSPASVITDSKDGSTSIWINRQRFGDIGGQRLGGFIGGVWSPDGSEAIAWGWSGGWRRWRCQPTENKEEEIWTEVGAITGHSGAVKDINWSPSGTFLISTGLDQSTRIHGPVLSKDGKSLWHELARPQVHGYDLLGATFLEDLKFASIADEKVVRIFEAPRHFVDLASSLEISSFSDNEKDRPMGASVPPLGLSNKADTGAVLKSTTPLSRRPFEGELASVTLWPETEKVFGHGYESITLASSNNRKYIATACKATSPEHAVVRIYDAATWQSIGDPLSGHSLTVTQISFSPDDQYVLTVSRDRSWRLYQIQETGGYLPVSAELKPHARIIWDCAWAREGDVFATASRDKSVKVWRKDDSEKWRCVATIKTEEAATAVDFTPFDSQHRRLIAVGLENGQILVYSNTDSEASTWQLQTVIDSDRAHVNHINRLRWRPTSNGDFKELASCSEDGTLRILIVHPAMV